MYSVILKNGQRLDESVDNRKFDFTRKDMALFLLTLTINGENKTIAVDLQNGYFYIGNQALDPDYGGVGRDYRLIYYKRHQFDTAGTPDHIHCYLLGWQFTTSEGENTQRIMFWYPEDDVIKIKRKR